MGHEVSFWYNTNKNIEYILNLKKELKKVKYKEILKKPLKYFRALNIQADFMDSKLLSLISDRKPFFPLKGRLVGPPGGDPFSAWYTYLAVQRRNKMFFFKALCKTKY